MGKDINVIDMNSPRERFFGWLPKNKATQWFILGNVVYIVFCCFIWPKLPAKFIWGWWTTYQWTTNFIIANWAAIMWGVYYYKISPILKEDEDESVTNSKGVSMNE